MPKAIVSYIFNDTSPYVSDLGTEYKITSKFTLPEDFDNSIGVGMVGAAGGQTTKIAGQVIQDLYNPCPDTAAIKPRKLVFIRSNGNSISLAINETVNLISAANSIKNTIDAGGAFPVVCIKLEGEEISNLNDVLGVNLTGENISGTPATGGVGSYYSGVARYSLDAPANTTILLPVRTLTSDPNNPPPIFLNVWNTYVGAFESVYPCGGSNQQRDHRRLIVNYLVSGGKSELRELPVMVRSQVLSCGRKLAEEQGVYCIGYKGESFSRFHTLL